MGVPNLFKLDRSIVAIISCSVERVPQLAVRKMGRRGVEEILHEKFSSKCLAFDMTRSLEIVCPRHALLRPSPSSPGTHRPSKSVIAPSGGISFFCREQQLTNQQPTNQANRTSSWFLWRLPGAGIWSGNFAVFVAASEFQDLTREFCGFCGGVQGFFLESRGRALIRIPVLPHKFDEICMGFQLNHTKLYKLSVAPHKFV